TFGIPTAYTGEVESLGRLVGPPIDGGPINRCDPTQFATSIYNSARNRDDPPASFTCNHLAQLVVTQIAYKGSDGNCYYSDFNGTFQLSVCPKGLPHLNATTSLSFNQIPAVGDLTFNWNASGARCFYTQGDAGDNMYGGYWEGVCAAGYS